MTALSLSPNPSLVRPGFTINFVTAGGRAPYTYLVLSGGVGGDVSSTGVYTAPNTAGFDIVQVTDSLNNTATSEITVDYPLSLMPNRRAMATNLSLPFSGFGGTPPYQYAVKSGLGFIDPDTGLFTSESEKGTSVVQVIDSLRVTSDASILICTPLELVCDILQTELGLNDGRVYLWDQKIDSPSDHDLFIAVGILSCKPFGNSNRQVSDDFGMTEVQSVNMRATLSIDIISRGPAARDRKEEVIMALNSTYSETQQEANSFRLFPLTSSFVNLSQEDGAAIPYRFNLAVNLIYTVSKMKSVPYYDSFSEAQVTTEP